MGLSYEERILAEHSSPGLSRGEMDRPAKRLHLAALGFKGDILDDTLDELYGPAPRHCPEPQAPAPIPVNLDLDHMIDRAVNAYVQRKTAVYRSQGGA